MSAADEELGRIIERLVEAKREHRTLYLDGYDHKARLSPGTYVTTGFALCAECRNLLDRRVGRWLHSDRQFARR